MILQPFKSPFLHWASFKYRVAFMGEPLSQRETVFYTNKPSMNIVTILG